MEIGPVLQEEIGESRDVELYFAFSASLPLDQLTIKLNLKESEHAAERNILTYQPSGLQKREDLSFIPISKTVIVTYRFEAKQRLFFNLTERSTDMLHSRADQVSLGEIFAMKRFGMKKTLRNGKVERGEVIIGLEEMFNQSSRVNLQIKTRYVQPNSLFCCFFPEPIFYRIYKKKEDRFWLIHQDQELGDCKQYTFIEFECSLRKLCYGDSNQNVYFQFYNGSSRSIIGETVIKPIDMKAGKICTIKGKNQQMKGEMEIVKYNQENIYEAKDFMNGGMQYALTIGIDFSASNGPYTSPDSLHYFNGPQKSYYQNGLSEITSILLDYDYDKYVPMYGFGTLCHKQGFDFKDKQAPNFFPLNWNIQDPMVYKLEGVLEVYRSVLPFLQFYGPTKIAPLISHCVEQSKEMKKVGKQYVILMILTDGEINDSQEVIDLIVECGKLPISIIFIGITNNPNEQWELMRLIDDNNRVLKDKDGRPSQRDMITFVEYMKYKDNPQKLAEKVLSELPRQVVEYHTLVDKKPKEYNKFLSDIKVAQGEDIVRLRKDMQSRMKHATLKLVGGKVSQSDIKVSIERMMAEERIIESNIIKKSNKQKRYEEGDQQENIPLGEKSNVRH